MRRVQRRVLQAFKDGGEGNKKDTKEEEGKHIAIFLVRTYSLRKHTLMKEQRISTGR